MAMSETEMHELNKKSDLISSTLNNLEGGDPTDSDGPSYPGGVDPTDYFTSPGRTWRDSPTPGGVDPESSDEEQNIQNIL